MASSRAQAMAQANALARRSKAGSLGSVGSGDYVSIPLQAFSRLPHALSRLPQACRRARSSCMLPRCQAISASDPCMRPLETSPPCMTLTLIRCPACEIVPQGMYQAAPQQMIQGMYQAAPQQVYATQEVLVREPHSISSPPFLAQPLMVFVRPRDVLRIIPYFPSSAARAHHRHTPFADQSLTDAPRSRRLLVFFRRASSCRSCHDGR